MTQKIDIRLERDPRYAAAQARYTELKSELDTLNRQHDDVLTGLNSLGAIARDVIEQEAAAMLSGAPAPTNSNRETLTKRLDTLTHRRTVVCKAVEMQSAIVAELRAAVGKAIATDLLPQHLAIVTRIAEAVLELNAALEAEHDLRDALYEKDVPYSAVLRSTQFPGFGSLRSPSSRVSGFILSLYEDDLILLSKIPEKLKPWALAKKHKPAAPAPERAVKVDPDGWGVPA